MIGDDQLDAEVAGQRLRLGDAGDAAIDGDHELHALLELGVPASSAVEAVAFFEPMRHMKFDLGIQSRFAEQVKSRIAVPVTPSTS